MLLHLSEAGGLVVGRVGGLVAGGVDGLVAGTGGPHKHRNVGQLGGLELQLFKHH